MEHKSRKILIVDDDPDIAEVIQLMLEAAGYSAETVHQDRLFALLLEPQHNDLPGLIVLDMLLAGEDGLEIARQLKQRESTRHIPLVMMSAHPQAEQEVLASGIDDFLAKPFELDEVLTKVAKHYPL